MKCDVCKRPINYNYYINDKDWLKAVGKKEGYRCSHCLLEKLGGMGWQIIWSEPLEKNYKHLNNIN